jgi:hypothetical protein
MPTLDLSRFGFACQVDLHGTVETSWSDGDRVVFLFGENHRDRDMKRLNVLDACRLIDAGVVGCVGTEVPMAIWTGSSRRMSEICPRVCSSRIGPTKGSSTT